MKKKILMTGWGFPPRIDGGLDVHVKHLFEELLEKDVDVTLVLPDEKAPHRENVIGVETGEGSMVEKARKMSSKVAELSRDFDVIHTHDWFGAESGFKAKKYGDCRWISTMHSISSGRTRKEVTGEVVELEELAVSKPDEVIAVSEKLADEIEEGHGRKPNVVHNGFSTPSGTEKDIKEELGVEGDMILFVGRHAEQKGIEHLIYGFKKFLEEGKATLVIGGDGHLRESLEDFVEMLGVEEAVIFEGFIPSEKLGDYYSSADLFVSPSINEPFGLTITEALESNTPVVATENGVSELTSGNSIVSVDPDSESISEGLEKGLKIRRVEEESRSWRKMAEETMNIYESL